MSSYAISTSAPTPACAFRAVPTSTRGMSTGLSMWTDQLAVAPDAAAQAAANRKHAVGARALEDPV
jgi:hypothetical protein